MQFICSECGSEKILTNGNEKKCLECACDKIILYNEKNYGIMIQELKTKYSRNKMLKKQQIRKV